MDQNHKDTQSENKYYPFVSNIKSSIHAVLEITPEGIITSWNKSAENIFGYFESEVLGKSVSLIIPSDNQKIKDFVSARVIQDGYIDHFETECLKKDGSKFLTSITILPAFNSENIILNYFAIIRDINDRKLLQDRYRTLVEKSNDGIVIIQDNLIKYCNPELIRMLGFPEDEILDKPYLNFVSEDSQPVSINNYRKRISGEPAEYYYEIELVNKDKLKIPVEVNSNLIQLEGKPAVMAILRDITSHIISQKALEQKTNELMENEEYQRKLLSSLLSGIMVVDISTHKIVEINEYACKLFGTSREEITGHTCHKFICPAEAGNCPATDLKQQVISSERLLLRADGTTVAVIKSVFKSKYKNKEYLIESITDIEALKQAQTALSESEQRYKRLYEKEKLARLELEEETRARAKLINVIAHELRTPLTPALLSIDTLGHLFASQPDSIHSKLINNSIAGVHTLKNRLEELLDLAEYTRSKLVLNFQFFDITLLLNRIVKNSLSLADDKNQRIELEIQPGLPLVNGDPDRIEQIISILLSNAMRYSPEDAVVTLKMFLRDHRIQVEVKDQGEGIAPEDQPKLFMPYHRVHQDRQGYPGIGLSLAIIQYIVEAHNGKIWVECEAGKGCTFKFFLPANIPVPGVCETQPGSETKNRVKTSPKN